MKILWYRFLDSFQSFINRKAKETRERRKWGAHWQDMTRSGRRYTRVERFHLPYIPQGEFAGVQHRIRPAPGWEWTCPNCKEYSFITESMMPEIIAAWAGEAKRMTDLAAAKGVRFKISERPTIERAGCTNCRYRPGAPE